MTDDTIAIRLMKASDFEAVVGLDQKIVKESRAPYYEMKFDKLFASKEFVPTSLVAEDADGKLLGFVMGELYIGEYGISRAGATLDTIAVDPGCRAQGVGRRLIDEFVAHLKHLGVQRLNTLVDVNDKDLIAFFNANDFSPAKSVVSLERTL